MLCILMLKKVGDFMGDVGDTHAGGALVVENADRFFKVCATIFKKRARTSHIRNHLAQKIGYRFTGPRICNRDGNTLDISQSRGMIMPLVMSEVQCQHTENLTHAQANTEINKPDMSFSNRPVDG